MNTTSEFQGGLCNRQLYRGYYNPNLLRVIKTLSVPSQQKHLHQNIPSLKRIYVSKDRVIIEPKFWPRWTWSATWLSKSIFFGILHRMYVGLKTRNMYNRVDASIQKWEILFTIWPLGMSRSLRQPQVRDLGKGRLTPNLALYQKDDNACDATRFLYGVEVK